VELCVIPVRGSRENWSARRRMKRCIRRNITAAGKVSALVRCRICLQLWDDNSWRKGWFLHPFCHLVFKAVRPDSPPYSAQMPLSSLISKTLSQTNITRKALAAKLNVSLGTLTNWEMGRTRPERRHWGILRILRD
jgi:hypothetical protein